MTTPVRFGVVFPTANADVRDFSSLLSRSSPAATLGVVELSWPTGTHSELGYMSDEELAATVAQLGDPSVIAEALSESAGQYEAVALAVTSASFLRSANDHRRQLEVLETTAHSAGTSTLRGFQDAITHLGVTSLSVASVYPPHFTDSFIDHVSRPGVDIVHRVDANARTDRDLAQWGDDAIIDLNHPRFDAASF